MQSINYLPYVMPIFRQMGNERSFAGTAFCIDDYLVTAGHVLTFPDTCYVRNGNDYHPLHFEQWIPKQLPTDDHMGYDVAFYPIPGLKSPFSLADSDAEPNDHLDILCWQMRGVIPRQVSTQGLVIKDHNLEGYFRLATVDHITHGCSGCPAFGSDGKVYGMITMGRTDVDVQNLAPLPRKMEQNSCWAFKTSFIRRFMP
ncbi:MAG: trypsin-like peptidase domain-containing protein [Muribaculaceae bacterium]|nr:trypsin-like peptidase domain-containing protein [Muribaculaceae bacterium]